MERNIIKSCEVSKIFKKKSIKLTFDGVGNCSISYVWNDGYIKQDITLGGYCDMEPYRWSVTDKWKVGKGQYGIGGPWSVSTVNERFVDFGQFFDKEAREYFWDREYIDSILDARDRLIEQLPIFKKKTDTIHERILDSMYSFVVEKEPSPIYSSTSNKWRGKLMFRGKTYRTKVYASFFDAKDALDAILEEQIDANA